jgi:hypothetical protein
VDGVFILIPCGNFHASRILKNRQWVAQPGKKMEEATRIRAQFDIKCSSPCHPNTSEVDEYAIIFYAFSVASGAPS